MQPDEKLERETLEQTLAHFDMWEAILDNFQDELKDKGIEFDYYLTNFNENLKFSGYFTIELENFKKL